MKKIAFVLFCGFFAMMFSACQQVDYKTFVGTWGVERVEYESYNTDWQGNPIEASMVSKVYVTDPNDTNNGIHMIFNADKTGELRDSAIDSLWFVWNENLGIYEVYRARPDVPWDSSIYCPDTVLIDKYTYSYDKDESVLYLSMTDVVLTYKLKITELNSKEFVYENKYYQNVNTDNRLYIERSFLRRVYETPSKSTSRSSQPRFHVPGSLLNGR
jgi:hypothetical protein